MITAIIQARMGSRRLPNKTLMEIRGKPLLWHLLEQLKHSRLIERIVIATTFNKKDELILNFADNYGIEVFRGDEQDVLDRFYGAAKKVKADVIVRVTPDCPLICPEAVDKVIAEYLKGSYSYVTNTLLGTYPDGCDVEVFSFEALEKAWKECKDPVEREHVTPFLRNPDRFKIKNVESEHPVDPREYKWSVDRIDDLSFARKVHKHLYKEGKAFTIKEIIDFLKEHPEIKKINSRAIMNEGYYRSILKGPQIRPKKIALRQSLALKKLAEAVIPGCSQTFSKGPSQFVQGAAPVFLEEARASRLRDIDGNEYIDYAMALGAIILGHNYPPVSKAVRQALTKGTSFTLPHRLEVELADLLQRTIPCAEMVRFAKNGSDATSGAVRLARAYTARDKVACCGYHGWQDWYIGTTSRNKGVPQEVRGLTLPFEYNKLQTLEKIFAENKNQIACVIMEPAGIVEPQDNFLQKVKELTHKEGALLIFDEVVTGFRFALGGAQEYFGVIPDLACFGKAMANGFPISAVVGKKNIMKLFQEVFYSFTFGGEITSISAAIATIKELKNKNVIPYLWGQGAKIRDGYTILVKELGLEKYTRCIGFFPRNVIVFQNKKGKEDFLLKSLFQQECLRRGILFTGAHNICFSHSDQDIDYTLRVYNTVLKIIKEAIVKNKVKKMLKGRPLEPVFRKP